MTSSELLFYTNPMSRGRIVRWMLEETGAPYRAEALAYGPVMKDPAYLAVNPMGKVPAIVHRGVVVTETAAICAYLADAFPAARLAPAPDSAERGVYYRWLFFGAGPLEAAVTNQALGFEPPSERRGMVGYGSLDSVVEVLAGAVAKTTYLCGDAFTAADVYVGAQIGWGLQFGTLPKRAEFEAYVARIYARPAHIRATQLDDSLMPPAPQTSA